MTRTVWDGDRVLHEIRAPAAAPEQDNGWAPGTERFKRLYGRVAYTFGAGLDQPLVIYRAYYDTLFTTPGFEGTPGHTVGFRSWILAALASRPSIVEVKLEELKRVTFALQLNDAEQRVSDWLRSGDGVDVLTEPIDANTLASLPPSAQRIFSQFPRIEAGGVAIGGGMISTVAATPGRILIGEDLEHARVFIGRAVETVWIDESTQVPDQDSETPYPSLAHYLLIVRETIKPNWWTGEFE